MKEALLKLHLSVLIAGGTGVFGRLITLGGRGIVSVVQAAACHADVLRGVVRIEQNQEGAADGRGENRVDGSAVSDALAVLLREHQGVERVYRSGVPLADELLHRLVRPAHQPPPDCSSTAAGFRLGKSCSALSGWRASCSSSTSTPATVQAS